MSAAPALLVAQNYGAITVSACGTTLKVSVSW
jgi:hypothetical protein